jgi:lipoprotein NlpI
VRRVLGLVLVSSAIGFAGSALAADQPGICKVAAVADATAGGAMMAADQCLAAATTNKDKAMAYNLKARALLASGSTDWNMIIDQATKALQLDSAETWPHLPRGQAHFRAGSLDLAEKDLKIALKSKSAEADDSRVPKLEWIGVQMAKGNWKVAQADGNKFFEWLQIESQGWAIAYVTASRAGDKAAASALSTKAVSWPANRYGSQIVSMYLGQITPDEAVVRSLSVNPTDAKGSPCRTNYYAGQLYMIRGDKVSAKKHFDAAVATGAVRQPEYGMALAELRGLQ